MISFVVALSSPTSEVAQLTRAVFTAWAHAHPLLQTQPVEAWRSVNRRVSVFWATQGPDLIGDVEHVAHGLDELALFTGRPVLWTDDGTADGSTPLRARTFLAPAQGWATRLDGRTSVVQYTGTTLTVYTDPHGMQPVYLARRQGVTWVSNQPELLRRLAASGDHRLDALAGLLAAGWAVSGQPLWSAVSRLPLARLHVLSPSGELSHAAPVEDDLARAFGSEPDLDEAARVLTSVSSALADWPGRDSVVPVTGGRDSRLVLAAHLRAGTSFAAMTLAFPHADGYPDTEDVRLARALCARAGVPHATKHVDAALEVFTDPGRALQVLALTSPGTHSLDDATTLTLVAPDGRLPIVHNGVGGEYARARFGDASGVAPTDLAQLLYDRAIPRWPRPLVNENGRMLLVNWLGDFCSRQLDAGVRPFDVPDAFYVHKVAHWAGTNSHAFENREDTVSPLMSNRLLPHQLGLSLAERRQEVFHLEVLRRLAPDLVHVPFDAAKPSWPSLQSPMRRSLERGLVLQRKVRRELRRRTARRHPAGDPYALLHAFARHRVAEAPQHEAWDVLDRERVGELLRADPAVLDGRSRAMVWRLATVFGGELLQPVGVPAQRLSGTADGAASPSRPTA